MDILTPKGKESAQQEIRAASIFQTHFPEMNYVHTPKDKPAKVDAVLTKNGEICAVVETKCRGFGLEKLQKDFGNQWLITWEKVESARQIAQSLSVPLVGFLYMIPDDTLMVLKMCEPDGSLCLDMAIRNTYTQETINGGQVMRNNVYISMDDAKIYRSKQ